VLQVVYMAQTRQVKRLEGLRLIARFWDSRAVYRTEAALR